MSINFPTTLTLIRLIASPLILPFLLVYLLPYHVWFINISLGSVFAVLSLTDFFDGYLARKYHQETSLGKLLDPIADKCLFYATLVALVAAGKLYFFWAVILIGREFFIMGLRLVALEYNMSISVSWIAKVKTATQMVCLMVIIINPYQPLGLWDAFRWNASELALLIVSTILSILTAVNYFRYFLRNYCQHIMQTQDPDELPE
jgi:CDP-diacylglycerol--glycerol-3-phosphate 3-phosphatidyltransferase